MIDDDRKNVGSDGLPLNAGPKTRLGFSGWLGRSHGADLIRLIVLAAVVLVIVVRVALHS